MGSHACREEAMEAGAWCLNVQEDFPTAHLDSGGGLRDSVAHHTVASEALSAQNNTVARFLLMGLPGNEGLCASSGLSLTLVSLPEEFAFLLHGMVASHTNDISRRHLYSVRSKHNAELPGGVSKSICQRQQIYEVSKFTFLQVREQNQRDLIPVPVPVHCKAGPRALLHRKGRRAGLDGEQTAGNKQAPASSGKNAEENKHTAFPTA